MLPIKKKLDYFSLFKKYTYFKGVRVLRYAVGKGCAKNVNSPSAFKRNEGIRKNITRSVYDVI